MESQQPSIIRLQRLLEERYEEVTRKIELISQSMQERNSSRKKTAPLGGRTNGEPSSESNERHQTGHTIRQVEFSGTESTGVRLPNSCATDSNTCGGMIPKDTAAVQTERAGRFEDSSPRYPSAIIKKENEFPKTTTASTNQFVSTFDTMEGLGRYTISPEPPQRESTRRTSLFHPVIEAQKLESDDGYGQRPSMAKWTAGNGSVSVRRKAFSTPEIRAFCPPPCLPGLVRQNISQPQQVYRCLSWRIQPRRVSHKSPEVTI